MRATRQLRKMTLTEHISWAELLGLDERPDELRFDGGSWVAANEAGEAGQEPEEWKLDWPTAVIVEVQPPERQTFDDVRPTLIERPLRLASAAI